MNAVEALCLLVLIVGMTTWLHDRWVRWMTIRRNLSSRAVQRLQEMPLLFLFPLEYCSWLWLMSRVL